MKGNGDPSNIQKQQFFNDSNLFEDKLKPDSKVRKKLSENIEKIPKESKYSFVVDWQIPELKLFLNCCS